MRCKCLLILLILLGGTATAREAGSTDGLPPFTDYRVLHVDLAEFPGDWVRIEARVVRDRSEVIFQIVDGKIPAVGDILRGVAPPEINSPERHRLYVFQNPSGDDEIKLKFQSVYFLGNP